MKVKKVIVILAVICLMCNASILMAGDIPLQRAIEKGIALDAGTANVKLAQEQSQLDIQKARDLKRFTVMAAGSYRFQSEQMEISAIPGTSFSAGAKHNYDLKLAVTQPVYTGGVLSGAVDSSIHADAIQELNLSQRKIQVAADIKLSYFTYRLLDHKKKSLQLLMKNLELHHQKLEDYYKEDLVKKSDVLETQIKITEIMMNLEQLQRQMQEEKISFQRLTGFDIDDIKSDYNEETSGFEDSFARFTAIHPALKQFRRRVRLKEQQKKITKGKYKPQVMSFAELHYGRPGIDFFKNEWSLYFQGGINISMKVFDWHRLRKENRIADTAIEQLKNSEQEMIDKVKKQMKQLYVRKHSLQKQLEQARQLSEISAEDAGLKKILYDENQAANVDYLAALVTTQRYQSMQQELIAQIQLVNTGINMLVGEQ